MLALAASLALSTTLVPADARESLARRAFLLEADAQCHLLTPQERAALTASARQARGALERAGEDAASLESRARETAARRTCADPLVVAVAEEAREAYEAWASLRAMDFPGVERVWTTRRVLQPDDTLRWSLWQRLDGGARFGLAARESGGVALLAVPAAGEARPIRAARIEFRDARRLPEPLGVSVKGLFSSRPDDALSANAAPEGLCEFIWASHIGMAEGELAPRPGADFQVVEFPAAALDAIADLEAGEAARIRLVRDGADSLFYVEAGDLAAALAFLAAERPDRPDA